MPLYVNGNLHVPTAPLPLVPPSVPLACDGHAELKLPFPGVPPLPFVEGAGGGVAVQLSPDVNPLVPQVYVRLPLYPAEHVNTSVLPYACDAAWLALLLPAIVASAFEGVDTALVRPSHVTAAHALSDVANCPF